MTPPDTDPSLTVLANTARSPSLELSRKSYEKTISSVFAYTQGTDVETGYTDHKLEQIRASKNSSLASSGSSAGTGLTHGSSLVNGSSRGPPSFVNGTFRPRSHSKTGSTQSVGSLVDKNYEPGEVIRHPILSESGNQFASGEDLTEVRESMSTANGQSVEPKRLKPPLLRGVSETSAFPKASPGPTTNLSSTQPATAATDVNENLLAVRQPGSSIHRFSSPPRMTQIPSNVVETSSRPPASPDPPRLTQRHTLHVPRAGGARDFSFSTSDEVVSATGRFSPTRDHESATPRHRRPSLGLVRKTTRSMVSDAYLDEVPPDEDAARWTEVIKQKRASRRKRREEEEDDDERVIVGKKVEEGHVNWVTAYNMLTGIRFTVSRTNAKMDRELTDGDFDARHKFSFDITGNELTPSAKYDFKFKDYSPWVFRHLRSIFGLDPADYLMSLTSKYILSELGSPGKSGSFFYFSRDYKYIIKTIHHAEHKLLRRILRDYYNHVRDNPNTLISQFYGLHRVKIPYGRKIHFVVMNNLFPPHRDIHQTFDLKGSTIGRDFREEDLENNPRATLKDLNWLRRDLHLEFQQQVKKMFLDQIQRDVALLQRLHIMDYSLLVGMHDLEKGNEENVRETTLQVFQPGGARNAVEDDVRGNPLLRTPSRLETARKAKELRQTLLKEKPMPMSLVTAKMPDEMTSRDERKYRIFYSDDGGIRATHEDGSGGDQIYYLGVIDCLTHYGFVKRVEHFWKGLSNPRTQISPIPPQNYGERFINFITGVTMTREEASRRKTLDEVETRESTETHHRSHHHHHHHHLHVPLTGRGSGDGASTVTSQLDGEFAPPRSPVAVERTMKRAQKQAEIESQGKGRLSEDEIPERDLKTVTVGAERGQETGRNSTTLPVVQEVGEASSDVSSHHGDHIKGADDEKKTQVTGDVPTAATTPLSLPTKEIPRAIGDHYQVEEKAARLSPASEYFTPTSPNFSRPIPHSPNLYPSRAATPQQTRGNPPRLGSGLIPHLAPMYSSPEALDPRKSVIGDDGEPIEGVEDLPGVGMSVSHPEDRHTVR